MMNYKQAAGRNWTHERRRSRGARLRPASARAEELGPSSVWYTVGALRNAAGRNWTHEPLPRRLAGARLAGPSRRVGYPLRERGGGDHDRPYEYRAPSARWSFPFSTREYARLLILKGRLRDRAERERAVTTVST